MCKKHYKNKIENNYTFSHFKRPRTTKGRSGWMRRSRILPIYRAKNKKKM